MARILTVLNYYTPHISGLTEFARIVAEHLASLGHQVTVLTSRHQPELPSEEKIGGVRVVRTDPLVRIHKGFVSVQFVAAYVGLARKSQLVHFHLPMIEGGLFSLLTPSWIPLVATYHCDVAPQARGGIVDSVAVRAMHVSNRMTCRRAAKVTVSSEDYARGSPVVGLFREKWLEVPPPDKAPRGLVPRSARSVSAPRIGFLGRFSAEKGIDVLLDAFALVLRSYPDAQLILGGNHDSVAGGSEFGSLRNKIKQLGPSVELTGQVPDSDLFAFYRSLDLFVLPSINSYEAFGMVQVEAMKSGVPVVASDMRGVRVPLRKTGSGLLCEPGNPVALAAAITETLSRSTDYEPLVVAKRAWDAFAPEYVLLTMDALFRSLIS
jgi:glycosyltransferase involved in cell wall biosynthesis